MSQLGRGVPCRRLTVPGEAPLPGTLYFELVSDHTLLTAPRLPLGERPLQLGRGADNDLVLADDTVSWHHATVWMERGSVRVRDRESTNGTWIDAERLDGEGEIVPGQVLRLGLHTRLRLGSSVPVAAEDEPAWRLEVLETGLSVAVPSGGLCVGMGPGVDLSLALADVDRFVVRPLSDGAEVEPAGQRVRRVAGGVAFAMGGLHFRLLPGSGAPVPTVGERSPTDRYRLRVGLDGPSGAEAVLDDPEAGLSHRVAAENRAVLLYVLATRMLDDRAAQVPEARQGWCSDEELATGVWGRESARMEANNLHVLLHRLRRELTDAGFDTSFLEKRSRALRARLVHVSRG